MPTKKTVTQTKKPVKKTVSKPESQPAHPLVLSLQSKIKGFKFDKKFILIGVVIVLLLLAYFKKNLFIAASVNGSPITNYELLSKMNQQFRDQTLSQMINDKLIWDEAKNKGFSVSDSEVSSRITEIETAYGGAKNLDSLLAQQGQTRQGIIGEIKSRIILEKLYGGEATVSASEIDQFITQNKDMMQASDSAGQKKEAENSLKQQKLSQVFSTKFQELKAKAKVQIF